MLLQCTVCCGGVLCGRAVYCMLGWVLCVMGVLYVMVVYFVLWRCTVC